MRVGGGLEARVEAADPQVAAAVRGLVGWVDDCLTRAGCAEVAATFVWSDRPLRGEAEQELAARAADGRVVLLLGPTFAQLAPGSPLVAAAGLAGGDETPTHEIRLRPGSAEEDGDDVVVTGRWLRAEAVEADVEVLRTAMAGLDVHPVMTWRPSSQVGVLTVGSTPATLADPAYRRLVHRWLRHATGRPAGSPVRVGILGFGAIGPEHVAGCRSVPGLELVAVCDRSEARLVAAR